jgi:hypothetical protein
MNLAKKCALVVVASAFLAGSLAGCGEKKTETTKTETKTEETKTK